MAVLKGVRRRFWVRVRSGRISRSMTPTFTLIGRREPDTGIPQGPTHHGCVVLKAVKSVQEQRDEVGLLTAGASCDLRRARDGTGVNGGIGGDGDGIPWTTGFTVRILIKQRAVLFASHTTFARALSCALTRLATFGADLSQRLDSHAASVDDIAHCTCQQSKMLQA